MSRLGSQPVAIPSGVTVAVNGDTVNVKGPKGEISWDCHSSIEISVEDNSVHVGRRTQERIARSMHGTARQLVRNMVIGVTEGYSRALEIVGVGYNAKLQGKKLVLAIGFCHPVELQLPEGVECECPEATKVIVKGVDKQKVGQFAAEIRAIRPPEPYKGKGIRYKDEAVRRKQAKNFGA
ncbi:MAG: 50S ribosomal protein L6 [Planctomycetota bacterium]|nr:50S ribosomal protein L6 [Planctomycetota bacterium]